MALFIQGFCGDVIPILYKDVHSARDQSPLGNRLGLSALDAIRKIKTVKSDELKVVNESVTFPLRNDFAQRIEEMEEEQEILLKSLRGTSLNFKTFLPLYLNYNIFEEYPSYYSHMYLLEEMLGRDDLEQLDVANRRNLDKYLSNIHAMEKLARIQAYIGLEESRQAEVAGDSDIDLEVHALKVGDFVLVSFPAEVSVQVGLNIKDSSPFSNTFVAGYTNGYTHYTPTKEQMGGRSYQDHNCLLTPEWQGLFEGKVAEILNRLK